MSFSNEEFRSWFRAFQEELEYDDLQIDAARTLATLELGTDPSAWCGEDYYKMMLAYLTAHHMVIMERQERGDSGALKGSPIEKGAGEVRVKYDSMNSVTSDATRISVMLNSTSYGQQFQSLKKRCRMFSGFTVPTYDPTR